MRSKKFKRNLKFNHVDEKEKVVMMKSPCVGCKHVNEDKNKCMENCERLREYQEMVLKQGIYAKI